MESATYIWYGQDDLTLYVRDQGGIYDGRLFGRYLPDAALPLEAVDTGYRRGELELWRAPGDRAVYVVRPGRIERWPEIRDPILCA